MKTMQLFTSGLISVLLASCCCTENGSPARSVNLFNGRDLSGWNAFLVEPGVTKADVWSVRDGILVCKGEPLGYLATDESFTNFKLVVEWRWAPGKPAGNSGVLMRINGKPQGLPRSLEAQLKSENAGDLYGFHGMTISGDPSRQVSIQGHKLGGDLSGVKKIEGNEKPPGEWNRYEIVLNGASLTAKVNGKLVNQATNCEIIAGPIGLQSEGGEIHFRKVALTRLQ
ncbi:MAG: DUF1080 domain-containing protein [Verrucomicrobia bacterium]|nr:DUF1080 domain-containing protein [Verrucomicrobiota bacterium]